MLVSIIFVTFALLGSVQAAINRFHPPYFNKEKCSGEYSWTMWFNTGKPNNETGGDREDMAIILVQNPTAMCHKPFAIQVQSTNYETGDWSVNWERKRSNASMTLLSFYSSEPDGIDYQVRYCCPTHSFAGTITTATTLPMLLDNTTCGRRTILSEQKRKKRIVGGEEAISNSWPWVSIHKESCLFYMYIILLYRWSIIKR